MNYIQAETWSNNKNKFEESQKKPHHLELVKPCCQIYEILEKIQKIATLHFQFFRENH